MTLLEAEGKTGAKRGAKSALRDWVRALEAVAPIAGNPRRLLPGIIEELASVRGDAPALVSAAECLTYGELAARANAYARWALHNNVAIGQTVCLMLPNRPDYLAAWLGLTSVGVVVALINTQLRGPALAHSIRIVKPVHAIVAAEFRQEFRAASEASSTPPKIWLHSDAGGSDQLDRIDRALAGFSGAALKPAERRPVTINDRALQIYTSGTTGLPKAANISHRRLLQWSLWFAGLMNAGPQDRMYDCLPLYHSVGGVVATGAMLARGGSVLIREKFSAQDFWDDVVDGGCTLFQYIGELCRYLVNAPDNAKARAHRLRLCCGNGMRADVWENFQARFAVPRILEFYAATEGNVSLYNVEGKVGAVGRVPPFLTHRFPLALVKFDAVAGEPARGGDDFCIRCGTEEIGEAIGKIGDASAQSGAAFEGYTDAAESERKILRHVFAHGDAWYRTGDLMRMDAAGFYYFIDRLGDTFRWKGENVATSEVATAIARFPGIREASVYGVRVPGSEGAAGMCAVVTEGKFDLGAFRRHLLQNLPPYARPLFLRVTGRIVTTSTFKHAKSELQRQGFDPATTSDPIYFNDPAKKAFVPLGAVLCARLQAGELQL